jgi:hypothetical protein
MVGDALVEIGPEDPEYEKWLAYLRSTDRSSQDTNSSSESATAAARPRLSRSAIPSADLARPP